PRTGDLPQARCGVRAARRSRHDDEVPRAGEEVRGGDRAAELPGRAAGDLLLGAAPALGGGRGGGGGAEGRGGRGAGARRRGGGDTAAQAAKDADARPRYEEAIDELRLYLDGGGRNELETYRKMADLYGKGRAIPNAVMNAVLMVETGLTYSPTDPDLLKKKDVYYYSVDPERLIALKEKVQGYFDSSYCITKAMSALNAKDDSPEMIEWATHLAKLARIMQPNSNGVKLVEARCMLRRGGGGEGSKVRGGMRGGGRGGGGGRGRGGEARR